MCLVLGIRSSVGVLALPFRQTKPFQPSGHSRKSILGSIFTVLNACFSFKLRNTRFDIKSGICLLIVPVPVHCFSLTFVTKHACLEYKEICTYTQDMFTDYKKQMFAHEHVFKGLNDR